MVAEVFEEFLVLADALLQPGALSRCESSHVRVALRALRLAHGNIVMVRRAPCGPQRPETSRSNCAHVPALYR